MQPGRGGGFTSRIQQVQVFDGLGLQADVEESSAGTDIVALVKLESVERSATASATPLNPKPMEAQDIEPPTLSMMFSVNDSPFAGKEGKFVTSRNVMRPARQGAGEQRGGFQGRGDGQQGRDKKVYKGAGCCIWACCWRTCGARGTSCPSASRT